MTYYWILIFSWLGVGRTQYINTAGPGADALIDPLDASVQYPPLPYSNNYNLPSGRNDYGTFQNDEPQDHNPFYTQDNEQTEFQRKRRTVEEVANDGRDKRWTPNPIDKNTIYLKHNERIEPFLTRLANTENNSKDIVNAIQKRSFSPWGGKRAGIIENMWSWKRSPAIREPTMPKRVRFSPWGGKRSGQMVYKPDTKGSKIIFSASAPEMTRIVSNYPRGFDKINIAGVQFTPTLDKRQPIKILALSSLLDEQNIKNDVQFKNFLEAFPRFFNPGHTYANINLKKDGKRKMKFSAWGGKRSPPIIGPIWTPTTQDIKESTLDTIVLIRNNQGVEDSLQTI